MADPKKKKSKIEKAGGDLFDFAIDREDIKWLMKRLPKESKSDRTTVEYELQILKIVCVGWSISYCMGENPGKERLLWVYWDSVRRFSEKISTTTKYMAGKDIDYFEILKDRLDGYVGAMGRNPDAGEPGAVIGPEFAGVCGDPEDIFTFMSGSKMFISTVNSVREYLKTIKLMGS